VFCRMIQGQGGIPEIWDIITRSSGTFGFALRSASRSTIPRIRKSTSATRAVAEAERILREIVEEKKAMSSRRGRAASTGRSWTSWPRIRSGREWQVPTIQLDMNMPETSTLVANEQGEKERIVMIHAAIMDPSSDSSSIAIEHYAGAFPVWLAPEQVRIPRSRPSRGVRARVARDLSRGLRAGRGRDHRSVPKKSGPRADERFGHARGGDKRSRERWPCGDTA